jgi:hypothetical protein
MLFLSRDTLAVEILDPVSAARAVGRFFLPKTPLHGRWQE